MPVSGLTARARAVAGGVLMLGAVAVGCNAPLGGGDAASAPSASVAPGTADETPATDESRSPADTRGDGDGDTAAEPDAQVVLVVTIDGLTPEALPLVESGAESRAGLSRMMREGASTLEARTAVELTNTLPNHTALLTGRRILGADGTGVTVNVDPGGTLESHTGRYVPSIFDVAHDHGLGTGFYAEKPKFDFLARSWDARHGAPDETGEDDGTDKLDRVSIGPVTRIQRAAVDDLRSGAIQLAFLHIAGPDHAGHTHGWLSRPYVDAVRTADQQLGDILRAIDSEPRLEGRTSVIVTADHGGAGRNHQDPTKAVNFTIPFYVWGAGVEHGDLYDVNPTRVAPGRDQFAYDGGQPIRNIDAANLSLRLLGLPLLPYYSKNAAEPVRTR